MLHHELSLLFYFFIFFGVKMPCLMKARLNYTCSDPSQPLVSKHIVVIAK